MKTVCRIDKGVQITCNRLNNCEPRSKFAYAIGLGHCEIGWNAQCHRQKFDSYLSLIELLSSGEEEIIEQSTNA